MRSSCPPTVASWCSPADRLTASDGSSFARWTVRRHAAAGHRRADHTVLVARQPVRRLWCRGKLSGGSRRRAPDALADAPRLNGGAWSRDGVILFSPDYNAGMHQVSDKGGAVTVVATLDAARKERRDRRPGLSARRPALPVYAQLRRCRLAHRFAGAPSPARRTAAWCRWIACPVRGPGSAAVRAGGDAVRQPRSIPIVECRHREPDPLADWGTTGQAVTGENGFSVSRHRRAGVEERVRAGVSAGWFDRQGRSIGADRRVTRLSGDPFAPQMSPDGAQLAFQDRVERRRTAVASG